MSYEPELGELVRGVGRSGKRYIGAFRQHSAITAGESTLSLQSGGGPVAGRVYVRTDSLEPVADAGERTCELCAKELGTTYGWYVEPIGRRTVIVHPTCASRADYAPVKE